MVAWTPIGKRTKFEAPSNMRTQHTKVGPTVSRRDNVMSLTPGVKGAPKGATYVDDP